MIEQHEKPQTFNFSAIRLKVASTADMHKWSHGEVTKPETINYRTQKPEKDGLFCERIFGPSKDWECYCGKYKRIRYKGIVCDKCGVEVTRSLVRRERMGHIDLASPVSHIWFLRGVPSKIGLVLDLSVQNLEKVIYFANFIVTSVDDGLREETLKQIDAEEDSKRKQIMNEHNQQVSQLKGKEESGSKEHKQELKALEETRDEKLHNLDEVVTVAKKELKNLQPLQIISEQMYQDLSLKYGHVFEADIGAGGIRKLLEELDLDALIEDLEAEIVESNKNKKRRLVRRLKLVKNLKVNEIRPEWMILDSIPVIPPDLRPMVQLDGGRFAASDLNDLYRRVINRNNRLKRLIELNAPEVITRNEKRMLQEAVDALIDNSARHGKTVTASTGQKRQLKSLADMLKGKQGRFRQNLLGKRVDYSGRSVIVVGPHLQLHQCGLPKRMALELFKPFVISRLIKQELVHNVRSASRFIESGRPEVWDILEDVTKNSHVLLNRAPTLHRLGIQAFQPILIEGKAIQVHPLVCPAFNADFDGDQMAVHVPLTEEAKQEAAELMLSSKNLLKPATGDPIAMPSQDIVLGCFYMTQVRPQEKHRSFASPEEAVLAYDHDAVGMRQEIDVRVGSERHKTSVGRILFNRVLPKEFGYVNETMDKKQLRLIVSSALAKIGVPRTAKLLDAVKELSLEYLTESGISWGMDDLPELDAKHALLEEAEKKVDEIKTHFESGFLTEEERHGKIIEIWANIKDRVTQSSKKSLDLYKTVNMMVESGARGSWGQITQMMGMKGLVTNPAGETIELPVKKSFKEGFDVLEYFISTHGARKGLSDTALRTANAGYLTRRLVDVGQDIVITEKDCGDKEGFLLSREDTEEVGQDFAERLYGRAVIEDLMVGRAKKPLVKAKEVVDEAAVERLRTAKDVTEVRIRSALTCRSTRGLCQLCYGIDLGYNRLVDIGTAVGVIAAQSIGEPGTQLTMRTFHTGGVAGLDITQGLPRVEELFEARPIRKPALVAEASGKAEIVEEEVDGKKQRIVRVHLDDVETQTVDLKNEEIDKSNLTVKDGDQVSKGDTIFEKGRKKGKAKFDGTVRVTAKELTITSSENPYHDFPLPVGYSALVKEGELITKGQPLSDGSVDLHELYRLRDQEAVQRYVLREIQHIYSSQGQKLNDKHIEIILRQMFSRYYVRDGGETELLSGEVVERSQFLEANATAKKAKKQEATGDLLLLGITKASLSTESFLSAASFQETARVLIDAAVSGKVDRLRGLKENVIIGKLIPAGTGFGRQTVSELIEKE